MNRGEASGAGAIWEMPGYRDGTTTLVTPPQSTVWGGATIRVLDASASPLQRQLSRGSLLVGAGMGADIVIAEPSVSRRHAQFTLVERGLELLDLGSRNGIFLHGQRIERLTLDCTATIRLGNVRVMVTPHLVNPAASSGPPLQTKLLGDCQALRQLFAVLERLQQSTVPVLLEGESGTGKEVVAREVHAKSAVASGAFVAVNCGAMDRALARSELFGHRRGAFTGAVEDRVGAFEQANGGTLFLDEIGELPLDVQPVLLRALETDRVTRIGESRERGVTVRLIAATNRDLASEVDAGRFRADLFYRLNVVRVTLPPLRERVEDIEILARHFAQEFGVAELTDEVIADLKSYHWPGNVRELRNVLRGYAVLGALPLRSAADPQRGYAALLRRVLDLDRPYQEQKDRLLNQFIDVYLALLLERTNGNQSEAARIAGLDRAHLNKMLARLKRRVS